MTPGEGGPRVIQPAAGAGGLPVEAGEAIVSREVVRRGGVAAIRTMIRQPGRELNDTDRLWDDLGMVAIVRQALAVPYSRITAKYGGEPVSQPVAAKLKTVGESVDLVHLLANARVVF